MLRRAALLLPLVLAACGGDDLPPRADFPALHYEYLTPLRLNVGAPWMLPGAPPPGPLDGVNPAPPGQALRRMALDRIGAGGSTGRAVFVIDQASITQAGGGLSGVLAVTPGHPGAGRRTRRVCGGAGDAPRPPCPAAPTCRPRCMTSPAR